jgi:hypothetical protein
MELTIPASPWGFSTALMVALTVSLQRSRAGREGEGGWEEHLVQVRETPGGWIISKPEGPGPEPQPQSGVRTVTGHRWMWTFCHCRDAPPHFMWDEVVLP